MPCWQHRGLVSQQPGPGGSHPSQVPGFAFWPSTFPCSHHFVLLLVCFSCPSTLSAGGEESALSCFSVSFQSHGLSDLFNAPDFCAGRQSEPPPSLPLQCSPSSRCFPRPSPAPLITRRHPHFCPPSLFPSTTSPPLQRETGGARHVQGIGAAWSHAAAEAHLSMQGLKSCSPNTDTYLDFQRDRPDPHLLHVLSSTSSSCNGPTVPELLPRPHRVPTGPGAGHAPRASDVTAHPHSPLQSRSQLQNLTPGSVSVPCPLNSTFLVL